jgi:hypothetical protein
LAGGVVLLLFATLAVLWGLSRAADRTLVWRLARPVPAGTDVAADALVQVGVASDGGLDQLVVAADRTVIGLTATHDLVVGALLQRSDVTKAPALAAGEDAVGAVLRPGRAPADLVRGDVVVAFSSADKPAGGVAAPVQVSARVIALRTIGTTTQVAGTPGVRAGVEVVLAVETANAATVAGWSAADALVVIRVPRP